MTGDFAKKKYGDNLFLIHRQPTKLTEKGQQFVTANVIINFNKATSFRFLCFAGDVVTWTALQFLVLRMREFNPCKVLIGKLGGIFRMAELFSHLFIGKHKKKK